jgi:phosphatidylinositol glycan class F
MAKSTPYLPLSEYITLQFLHGAWLVFSFAWLPRSKSLFTSSSPSVQTSSADRPEHPLLTPITSNVTLTLACSVAGAAFISVWWAAHLRHWHEGRAGPHASEDAQLEGEDELKQRQNQFSGKLTVCYFIP